MKTPLVKPWPVRLGLRSCELGATAQAGPVESGALRSGHRPPTGRIARARRRRGSVLALVAVLLGVSVGPAGAATPADFSAAGQDALDPQVAVAPDGRATVTWYRSDGSNSRVQARRIAADGTTLGAVVNLSPAGQDALDPQVAVAADGSATVAWRRYDGSAYRVQARRIAADGTTLGDVVDLSAAGQPAFAPQLAVAADGSATVTWYRGDGSNTRVQARRIAANGTTLGPVVDLSPLDALAPQPQPRPTPGTPKGAGLLPGRCANVKNGGPGRDTLLGSAFGDRLSGRSGNDVLTGLGGGDCLSGDRGRDRISGGQGNDRLSGGTDKDRLGAGPGNDRLSGDSGNDRLSGNQGRDRLSGGSGNDRLRGGSGRDRFSAGSGDDTIISRDGRREAVRCGRGSDRVRADRGDRLIGCERVRLG